MLDFLVCFLFFALPLSTFLCAVGGDADGESGPASFSGRTDVEASVPGFRECMYEVLGHKSSLEAAHAVLEECRQRLTIARLALEDKEQYVLPVFLCVKLAMMRFV